jgi:ABC-2 type transport system permease protein
VAVATAVPVLLRADAQALRNRVRRLPRKRLALMSVGVPLLALAVLAPAVGFGAGVGPLGPRAVVGVLTLGFTTLAMVMLVVGLSSVMVSFFTSRDLLLLAGAPIRVLDIYLARLVVAARASALVAGLLLASVIGYGAASGAGLAYWLAAPVAIACVVLAVTGLQVALLSAVVRVVPVARARTLVSLVAAVIGSAFWLSWLFLRTQDSGAIAGDPLLQGARGAAGLGDTLVWLPTAWPARALAGFARGDSAAPLWLLVTVASCCAAVLLGHAMFAGAFRRGLSALGEVPRRTHARAATAASVRMQPRIAPGRSPLLALVGKEWLVMRRDSRRLAALVPLCAIAAFYPLVGPGSHDSSADFWSAVLRGGTVSLMLPFFFTQILAAPAVAMEGRAFLLVRLAPIGVATLLRAKAIAVAAPMVAATTVSAVVLGVSHHGGVLEVLALVLMGLWLAVGATAIGVSGGALGARFDAEDPRRAVSTGAALGATAASLAFLGLSMAAALQLVRATGLAPQSRLLGAAGADVVAMVGGLVCIALAVGLVAVMLTMAERRLERWQPDGGRAPLPAIDWTATG